MTGILLLDKPAGPTSHDVVASVRRVLGTRRVGHFGTLDPFATGLLVLAIGPATRLAPYCAEHAKTYLATVRLGVRSTTDDSQGECSPVAVTRFPTAAEVAEACARWTGVVAQVPPSYSAKHIRGTRAYALARAGEHVSLTPSRVTIHRISIQRYEAPDLDLVVECGPGTYIRALARDLGEDLGTGGYCADLRRTRSGPFDVENAVPPDSWDDPRVLERALLGVTTALVDRPIVDLGAADARTFAHGGQVGGPAGAVGWPWVGVSGPAGFVGIGEVRGTPAEIVVQPKCVLFPDGEGNA